jgi:hypothetical protein
VTPDKIAGLQPAIRVAPVPDRRLIYQVDKALPRLPINPDAGSLGLLQ